MKTRIPLLFSVLAAGCGSSSPDLPDAHIAPIDAPAQPDANVAPVTVQVNQSVGVVVGDVRFEPPTGPAIESQLDSHGFAMAVVPPHSTVTVIGQQTAGIQASYFAFSYIDVQPGDALVIGQPAAVTASINFDVNFTAFDQTSTVDIATPCGGQSVDAGSTVAHFTAQECVTSQPMDIIATITDDSGNITQVTELLAQTAVDGASFVLPSAWTQASSFGVSLAHIPTAFTQAQQQIKSTSQGNQFFSEDGPELAPAGDGSLESSLAFAPSTLLDAKLGMQSTTANITIRSNSPSQLLTYDFATAAIPAVGAATLDSASRVLTWSEGAVVGTAAPESAIVSIAGYQLGSGNNTQNVNWFVMSPPHSATTGFVWPTLPTADAALDIANASTADANVTELFASSDATYDIIRPQLFDFISEGTPVIPGAVYVTSNEAGS